VEKWFILYGGKWLFRKWGFGEGSLGRRRHTVVPGEPVPDPF